MSTTIHSWRAQIPGTEESFPMLCVDPATDEDYAVSGDGCSNLQTCIWYTSAQGGNVARRIAGELARRGFALLYQSDRDVVILIGERHHIVNRRLDS